MKPVCGNGVEGHVGLLNMDRRGRGWRSTPHRRLGVRLWLWSIPIAGIACRGGGGADSSLGPPDSYALYDPIPADPSSPAASQPPPAAADPSQQARPRPFLREVPLDDPRALPVHRLASEGFIGEILRTDYLAKQLVRDGYGGKSFSALARAQATEPTVLVLAGSRTSDTDSVAFGSGFDTPGLLGRRITHAHPTWIEIGSDPPSDPAFVQTATARIARLVAERLTRAGTTEVPAAPPSAPNPAAPLVDGYALAMEVIAREWRVGEGPAGTLPPNAGTGSQRTRFASVRQNAFVFDPDRPGVLRPGSEMLTEPGVIAAVLYRMAQLKGIGRRVAPKEFYGSLVTARVPEGVSPAAVLGTVRNFQAKLLTAWGRAILAGHPPRDLVDLVEAYAGALPDERGEVYRIFVATTYGATVKPGGVSARAEDLGRSIAELAALGAEVAAGRRSPRAGLPGSVAERPVGDAPPARHPPAVRTPPP